MSSGTESGIHCIETGSVADETEKDGSAICETLGKNDMALGLLPYKKTVLGLWKEERKRYCVL
jgi:hypothetical protein